MFVTIPVQALSFAVESKRLFQLLNRVYLFRDHARDCVLTYHQQVSFNLLNRFVDLVNTILFLAVALQRYGDCMPQRQFLPSRRFQFPRWLH